MNVYEFSLTALCPNEPHPRNFYAVKVESAEQIWTEELEGVADEYVAALRSQEDITEELAARFPQALSVTLVGQHGRVQLTTNTVREIGGKANA